MKKTITFFLLINFFIYSCSSPDYELPEDEQIVSRQLNQVASLLKKKYTMRPTGTIVSMPGGNLKLLGLDFKIVGPLSKEDLRKILIDSTQQFVSAVNKNEAIRPYLENYPFEIKNIEITLFLVDSKRYGLNDPYIGIAGISLGELDYQILITIDDIPVVKSEFRESYEDALNAMQKP